MIYRLAITFVFRRPRAVGKRGGRRVFDFHAGTADSSEGEISKSTGKFVQNGEHNHRHAKGGRKLAARWQKEWEKVSATKTKRATLCRER